MTFVAVDSAVAPIRALGIFGMRDPLCTFCPDCVGLIVRRGIDPENEGH
jgi:hypothetical protein